LSAKDKRSVIIVFAREPKIGKVKTRLQSTLPPEAVLDLYKAFLKDIFQMVLDVQCSHRVIYYSGNGAFIPFIRHYQYKFELKRQTGKDLGARMYKAFEEFQNRQYGKMIMIGTDCLTMTVGDISSAFDLLEKYDCLLGPAYDGGYYLIGLKHAEKQFFENINWSTTSVFRQTIQKMRRVKKKVFLLPEKEDIDTIQSLRRFSFYHDDNIRSSFTDKTLKRLSLT